MSDDALNDKLQSDPDLGLEAATLMCRRYEASKQAQAVVRAGGASTPVAVDGVKSSNKAKSRGQQQTTKRHNNTTSNKPGSNDTSSSNNNAR